MSTIDITSLVQANEKETSEFLFNVNAGLVEGVKQERKYGTNDNLDTGSVELIRDGGGTIEDYPYLTANAEMYIVSTNALDTTAIHILGLKADEEGKWNLHDVRASLNGTTPVSIGEFIRVFRIRPQSDSHPLGTVYISELSGSIPNSQTQRHATLTIGKGSTLMAMYTVPSDYTAFIYRVFSSTGKGEDASFSYNVRPFNKVFHTIGEVGNYATAVQLELGYEKVREKSDINVTATTLNNNTVGRSSFHFILVPNNYINI